MQKSSDLFIQLNEHCTSIRSKIEKEIWTSERILTVSSIFQSGKLDSIFIIYPNMSQKFLYTFWLIICGLNTRERKWINLMQVDLQNKVSQSGNIWIKLRTEFGDLNKETCIELLLNEKHLGYSYSTFYSIVGTKEFKQKMQEIRVNIKHINEEPVKYPQRKRGYTDKGSLRPKHLSSIWTYEETIDQIIEKQKKRLLVQATLQELFFGMLL